MRKKNLTIAFGIALTLLFSNGFCISDSPSNIVYGASLDTTSHGFGQGNAVDQNNCPLGALDFNSQYCQYNAFALSQDKNTIILTFDQGYENGYTSSILDTLKEKNVKAVFFLTGDYAKKETELVKRMIDEGHTIGNHGMTHASMPKLSQSEAIEEIQSLHNYVLEKYNYDMQYLRPPCGEFSEQSLATTQQLGYKTLFWSFAYVDWKTDAQPNPSAAYEKIISSAHGGEIILLHSVSATNASILGDVIDNFRSQGFIL